MLFLGLSPSSNTGSHFKLNIVALAGMKPYKTQNSCDRGDHSTLYTGPSLPGI